MRVTEIPTWHLFEILEATEALAGPESASAVALRRVLENRCCSREEDGVQVGDHPEYPPRKAVR